MKLQALRFVLRPQPSGPSLCELDEGTLRNEKHDIETLPVAYVVRDEDLRMLRELKDLVVDRGAKHRAKELSALLFGYNRIPIIRGSYKSAGQLVRSVTTLLGNAGKRGEKNVFVVGVGGEVFDDLMAKAAAGRGRPKTVAGGKSEAESPAYDMGSCAPLLDSLEERAVPRDLVERVVGDSPQMRTIRQIILRIAPTDISVILTGENGVGKDVVAKAIHQQSLRRAERFIPVNCAGIPRELLESELFGHVKGSFTGAGRTKKGLWALAHKGTLFLDEVADLSLRHQAKILRALDNNEIWPVGALKPTKVDVRVVAATNADILDRVESGKFREDLYYRLRDMIIFIPPFRKRREDIPLMAAHFWRNIAKNKENVLPKEVLAELQSYPLPGNAREIRSALRALHAMYGETNLKAEYIRSIMLYQPERPVGRRAPSSPREIALHNVDCFNHIRRTIDTVRACKVSLRPILRGGKTDPNTVLRVRTELCRRLEELELLCLSPLLFHGEETFSAVRRLKGKLRYFSELLAGNLGDAMAFWKQDLSAQFTQAQHAIFEEAKRLTHKN